MRIEAMELYEMYHDSCQTSSDLQAELHVSEEGAAALQTEIRELGAERDALREKAVERSMCTPRRQGVSDEEDLRRKLVEQEAKFLQLAQSSGKELDAMQKCMTQEILASSLQARLAGREVHCGLLQREAEEERQSLGAAAELRDELSAARSQLSLRELQLHHIRSFMKSLRTGTSSGNGSPVKGKALLDAFVGDSPRDVAAANLPGPCSTECAPGPLRAAEQHRRGGREAGPSRSRGGAGTPWMQNYYGTQHPPPAA